MPVADINDPVVAIHIAQQFPYVQNAHDLYMATRGLWRINIQHARNAKYALAVFEGTVREVYAINDWECATRKSDRYWKTRCAAQGRILPCDINIGRHQFIGVVAPRLIREKYLGKTLPRKHGQNPLLYFNC